jgi:hypothetical protein
LAVTLPEKDSGTTALWHSVAGGVISRFCGFCNARWTFRRAVSAN